jgi:flavin-dependent dehydrogenase
MKEYDVFIAGGAVAGPVAAKFCAAAGLKTLLIEKDTVPREKPCSGIQFPYFERIIGDRIPRERLCNNELNRVEMFFPDGKRISTPVKFPMLNFMRDTFDEWLCRLAEHNGAEFRDSCSFHDMELADGGVIVRLKGSTGGDEVRVKYVIDATGLRPAIRRLVGGSAAFKKGSTGAALNYYFTADGDLDKNTLYQFWNVDFNNMMFAWVYNKTLSDGRDYWVAGTGYDRGIRERQELFFDHVKKLFNLTDVRVVKREGYSSSLDYENTDRIWLGAGNVLMVGDAAGLIDLTRGVGMDAAALSGRLAARAIVRAEKRGTPAIDEYTRLMRRLAEQTRKNQSRGIHAFANNGELNDHLKKVMLPMSLRMIGQGFLNRFRTVERMVMLP